MTDNTFIFKDIPFAPDITELEKSAFFFGEITDPKVIALWEKALRMAKPKAMIAEVEIVHGDDGRVTHIGDQPVSSTVLDKNLANLYRAFPFIATCGSELNELCGNDADPGSKTIGFSVRMMALRTASEFAMAQIRERWNIPKLADMNPGSLPEWPITEQTKIFALLGDPQAEIGVTLGENFFMYPTETSSGLAFETDRDYKNCMVCTRAKCVGRRAPYNAELAKELRG